MERPGGQRLCGCGVGSWSGKGTERRPSGLPTRFWSPAGDTSTRQTPRGARAARLCALGQTGLGAGVSGEEPAESGPLPARARGWRQGLDSAASEGEGSLFATATGGRRERGARALGQRGGDGFPGGAGVSPRPAPSGFTSAERVSFGPRTLPCCRRREHLRPPPGLPAPLQPAGPPAHAGGARVTGARWCRLPQGLPSEGGCVKGGSGVDGARLAPPRGFVCRVQSLF